MLGIIKKGILWFLLFWLAGVLITGVAVPAFQKAPLEPEIREETGLNRPKERILCIDDNEEALVRRLQVIESAEKELILSTYYLGDDNSGRDIMSALLQAADRGVHIRILADGFCGLMTLGQSSTFHALTESPNVEAKIYNPVNILFPWRANYRMHDKYLIADDQLYLLGGRNNRDVSLGNYPGKHDIDRDILVWTDGPGGSLSQVRDYFEQVWTLPESKSVRENGSPHRKGRQVLENRYMELKGIYPQAFEPVDFQELTMPVAGIDLITNPIEAERKVPKLWSSLTSCMAEGEDILIQTPYIICNSQMYSDLARLSTGGRDIRILTNCVEYGANPCGCADLLNHKKLLRETGAELWEYAGGRSTHAKAVLVDDRISIVGTFNLDMRSAYLDTEMMLVIDSPELNASLREITREQLDYSRSVDQDGNPIAGAFYEKPPQSLLRGIFYSILRLIIIPIRHLL